MRSFSKLYIFVSIVLILVPWSVASNLHVSFPSIAADDESQDGAIVEQLFEPSSSSVAVKNPPKQPRCWFNALKVFQPKEKEEVETLNKMCAKMGPQEQQAFAFEIARCHLADMGRAIIETFVGSQIDDPQNCTALAETTSVHDENNPEDEKGFFPNLKECLVNLTQDGYHAYTYFFTQVVQLCNRLTEHLVADFREHTSMQLAKFSQQAVSQFNYLIQRQQDAFEEREEAIRQRHEAFYASMHDMQQEMWEGQSSRVDEFKVWTSSILDDWGTRAQQQKEQQQAWFLNQTSYLESKAAEWGRQHWFSFAGFLSSFLSMDKLYTVVTYGYNFFASYGYDLFAFLFYFIGVLYVAYILTLPRRCQGFKGGIFAVIFMEGLAELCLTFGVENGQVSSTYQKALIASLRNSAFCFEALIYAVGLVFSCCCWGRSGGDHGDGDDGNDDSDHDLNQDKHQQGQTGTVISSSATHERHRQLIESEVRRLMQEAMTAQTGQQLVATASPVHNHVLPSPEHHHAALPPTNNLELPSPPPMMHRRTLPNVLGNGVVQMANTAAESMTIPTNHQFGVDDQKLFVSAGAKAPTEASPQQPLFHNNDSGNLNKVSPPMKEGSAKKRPAEQLSDTNDVDGSIQTAASNSSSSPKRRRVMTESEEGTEPMETSNTTTIHNGQAAAIKQDASTTEAPSMRMKDDTMEEWEDDHSTDAQVENDDDDNSSMYDDNDEDGDGEDDEQQQQNMTMTMETGDADQSDSI